MTHPHRSQAASIGITEGYDGPTAVYVTHKTHPAVLAFAVGTLFGIAVAFFAAIGVHKKKNG